jgi:seryl-tRNA synthetase
LPALRLPLSAPRRHTARVLDIKLIRDQPELVRARLASRGAGDEARLDEVRALDEQRRHLLAEVESLKAARNRLAREIGALMARKATAEAEAKKAESRQIGERIPELDRQVAELESRLEGLLLRLPNLPHPSVPVGASAADNPVVREWGRKPEFAFPPRTHVDLCQALGLVDFERGAKLAGSGFLLYTGWGARLERALIQFLLDLHLREHGYSEVSPPYLVSREVMVGVGQFPKFEDQAYAVREGLDEATLGKLYLVPTAEAPVANIHRGELLPETALPIRYVAYSPCFRAEAGAAGVGTRGMIRVHQFDKVELIQVVRPEDGYAAHEAMVTHAERVLQLLGLHYRVVLLCTGDLGFASAKTYDLEVWAPGQGAYLEVSSVSNCEDFQARRIHLRYKRARDGQNVFPHVLNGSGTALARLFVALVETYQQADGRVLVPEPLRPYLRAEQIPA